MRRQRTAAEARPGRLRRMPTIAFPLNFSGRAVLFETGNTGFRQLCAAAPEAIVAPLQSALELAAAALSGTLELPSLSFAFIVLTDLTDAPLEIRQRDLLWRAFRVPVFEQLRDADGKVIARECETHNGLHLVPGTAARIEHGTLWIGKRRTHLSATIADEHCECGAETPRLRNLAPLSTAATAAA